MADPAVAEAAKQAGTTRAVAAMHRAAREHRGPSCRGQCAHSPADHRGRNRSRAAACAGHRCAGGLCERGGKQGDPLCNLRTARRACHCCHGPQRRQQCGRSHLQRPCLFCRRNAGPLCQRVERIKERPSDRFLRKQRQCRIDKGSPCLTNREGLSLYKKAAARQKRAAAFEKMMVKRSSGKIICPDARCPGRTRQWCGRRRTCLLWQCSPDTCAASPSGRRRNR